MDPHATSHKVAFEYGVSFAVNYIRDIFLNPAPDFDPSLGGKLSGYAFTQEQADAIKEYVQMSVRPK